MLKSNNYVAKSIGIENGNNPIEQALVFRDQSGVRIVDFEDRKIVRRDLITTVLNAALIQKFPNLDASYTPQGGVEGIHNGEAVQLRNCANTIGLDDLNYQQAGESTNEVLSFYEGMLRYLLFANNALGENDEESGEKVWDMLKMALTMYQEEEFCLSVIRKFATMSDEKREHLKRAEDRIDIKPNT